MAKKIVLIGAGSVKFCEGLILDLIAEKGEYELDLVDIDPVALDVADNLARRLVEAYRAPITVRASVERRDFLSGADAVVSTIGVGSRPAWEKDVFITRQFSIYYPVGDTFRTSGHLARSAHDPQMVDMPMTSSRCAPGVVCQLFQSHVRRVPGDLQSLSAKVVGVCGVKGIHDRLAKLMPIRIRFGRRQSALTISPGSQSYVIRKTLALLTRKMSDRLGRSENLCWDLSALMVPIRLSGMGTWWVMPTGRKQGGYYGKTLGLDGTITLRRIL
jgi:hypothetical protein